MAALTGHRAFAQQRRHRRRPRTPRTAAPVDLTGNWVSVVTEEWLWRMTTPRKGDYTSIPLSDEGRRVADQWDPSTDGSCKAYGAGGLMRIPTRLRISWRGDDALSVETDAGQQTRLLRFDRAAVAGRAIAAGPLAGRMGADRRSAGAAQRQGHRRRASAGRHAEGRHHEPERRLAAQERRRLQRERHAARVLGPRRVSQRRRLAHRHVGRQRSALSP